MSRTVLEKAGVQFHGILPADWSAVHRKQRMFADADLSCQALAQHPLMEINAVTLDLKYDPSVGKTEKTAIKNGKRNMYQISVNQEQKARPVSSLHCRW